MTEPKLIEVRFSIEKSSCGRFVRVKIDGEVVNELSIGEWSRALAIAPLYTAEQGAEHA